MHAPASFAVQVRVDSAHAPEQQSPSTKHGARRAAHAVAFATQIPSWHVAPATHGLPLPHLPSISTSPPSGD
jgi:hypothetical protein